MNNNKPKVSVITVTYNTEAYLRECLDSLMNQTLTEVEFICIDNGYPDNCVKIIKEYVAKDNRFQCHEIRGINDTHAYTDAINYGLSLVKGEYVAILDSDDWLEVNALESLYSIAIEKDLDVLKYDTNVYFHDEKSKQTSFNYIDFLTSRTSCEKIVTGIELFNFLKLHNMYHVNIFLFLMKTNFLTENRIKMYGKRSDNVFTFQLLITAKRASQINIPYHNYRIHQTSATITTNNESVCKSSQIAYTNVLNIFYSYNFNKETNPLIYLEIDRLRAYYARKVFLFEPKKCLELMEIMYNYEHALFDEPLVSFDSILITKKEFLDKQKYLKNICFFGAGKHCENELNYYKENNLLLPVVICDNDASLYGREIGGIPITSIELALEKYSDLTILITDSLYYHEIIHKLLDIMDRDRIWIYPEILSRKHLELNKEKENDKNNTN